MLTQACCVNQRMDSSQCVEFPGGRDDIIDTP